MKQHKRTRRREMCRDPVEFLLKHSRKADLKHKQMNSQCTPEAFWSLLLLKLLKNLLQLHWSKTWLSAGLLLWHGM